MARWFSLLDSEMEYGLTDSGAKLVFCDVERFKRIEPSAQKLNLVVVVFGIYWIRLF